MFTSPVTLHVFTVHNSQKCSSIRRKNMKSVYERIVCDSRSKQLTTFSLSFTLYRLVWFASTERLLLIRILYVCVCV